MVMLCHTHFTPHPLINSNLQSWNAYFTNVDSGMPPGSAYQRPPVGGAEGLGLVGGSSAKEIEDHLNVQALIRAYQVIKVLPYMEVQLEMTLIHV